MLSLQLGTARLIVAIDCLGVTPMPIQTSSLYEKHHQADTSLPLVWKLSQRSFPASDVSHQSSLLHSPEVFSVP